MPDIHPLIDAEYAPYDVGVMGEFDVRILTELFGGQADSDGADAGVERRDLLRGAERKSAVTPEEKDSTASIALLYESQWKNEDSARSFVRVYAGQLQRKYSGLVRQTKDESEGESTSRCIRRMKGRW